MGYIEVSTEERDRKGRNAEKRNSTPIVLVLKNCLVLEHELAQSEGLFFCSCVSLLATTWNS